MKWPWRKKRRLPELDQYADTRLKEYVKRFEDPSPKPIEQETYVVLDFETTGLDPEKDAILSFGFLKIENSQLLIGNRLEGYIQQEDLTSFSGADIHQITRADLHLATNAEQFAWQALQFIEDAILVGHHVAFDIACLNRTVRMHTGISLLNKSVDTAVLGARLENPLMKSYAGQKALKKLDALCKDYDIQPEARHSASGDTYTTALLFLKLLRKAHRRGIKYW